MYHSDWTQQNVVLNISLSSVLQTLDGLRLLDNNLISLSTERIVMKVDVCTVHATCTNLHDSNCSEWEQADRSSNCSEDRLNENISVDYLRSICKWPDQKILNIAKVNEVFSKQKKRNGIQHICQEEKINSNTYFTNRHVRNDIFFIFANHLYQENILLHSTCVP